VTNKQLLRRSFQGLARAALVGLLASGCGAKDEVVVQTPADKALSVEQIDQKPLNLLPSGVIGLLYVEPVKLQASQFGPAVLRLAERAVRVPRSTGFEPNKHLEHVYVGFYSLSGADVVGVATGTFEPERIEKAAETEELATGVGPLSKSSYAGRNLYTVQDGGFVALSRKTLLFGNTTGMRRALDRVAAGRHSEAIPPWFDALLQTPGAALVAGFDLSSHPVPDATRSQVRFLDGLSTVRLLGNYEAPGLNFAGTLGYTDAEAAQRGAANLQMWSRTLNSYGWLMALAGISQPIERLEATAQDEDVQFVMALEGRAVAQALHKVETLIPQLGQGR
jgi:hypothetical protein